MILLLQLLSFVCDSAVVSEALAAIVVVVVDAMVSNDIVIGICSLWSSLELVPKTYLMPISFSL